MELNLHIEVTKQNLENFGENKEVFILFDYDLNDILNNQNFWIYFFLTSFPLALDDNEEKDMMEFIEEEYDCSQIQLWYRKFVKYYDGVIEENDGYIDNPTTIEISLNYNKILKIEFHPGDTIYFIDNIEIGCTGPEYVVKKISWNNFIELINNLDKKSIFLLLPMAYIKKDDKDMVKKFLMHNIQVLPFKSIHYNMIVSMLLNGLIYE